MNDPEIIPYSMSEGKIKSLRVGTDIIELPDISFDRLPDLIPAVKDFISTKAEYETFKSAYELSEKKFLSAKERFDQILNTSHPTPESDFFKMKCKCGKTYDTREHGSKCPHCGYNLVQRMDPEPHHEASLESAEDAQKEFESQIINPPPSTETEPPKIEIPTIPTNPKDIATQITDPIFDSFSKSDKKSVDMDDIEKAVAEKCAEMDRSYIVREVTEEVINLAKEKKYIKKKGSLSSIWKR